MEKIRFSFEWKQDPALVEYDNGTLSQEFPKKYRKNEKLVKLMNEISQEYDNLFIDNSYEFTFVGFKDEESWLKFKTKVDGFIELLKKEVEPEYEVDTSDWNLDCKNLTLLKGEEV